MIRHYTLQLTNNKYVMTTIQPASFSIYHRVSKRIVTLDHLCVKHDNSILLVTVPTTKMVDGVCRAMMFFPSTQVQLLTGIKHEHANPKLLAPSPPLLV